MSGRRVPNLYASKPAARVFVLSLSVVSSVCWMSCTLDTEGGLAANPAPGHDASTIDAPTHDASDASTADALPDVKPDVNPDVVPDVAPDVAPDVVPDVVPDVAPDVVPDV